MRRRSSENRAARFRSSREAYHWIMWDGAFEPGEFVIGYDDHDDELKEIALESFEPGGEIPFHRIWYIRRDEEKVWDRDARIDRLADIRGTSLNPAPPTSLGGGRVSASRVKRPRSRASFLCPQCAAPVETSPDAGGGAQQSYVEDCPVCCRPNKISARWADEHGEFVVQAMPDG